MAISEAGHMFPGLNLSGLVRRVHGGMMAGWRPSPQINEGIRMKTLVCAWLVNLMAVIPASAQAVEGDWQGTLKTGPAELRLVVHLSRDEKGTLKATLDSPDQASNGFPVTAISLADSTLRFEVPQIGGSYEGKVNAGATAITGTWRQAGSSLSLDLVRVVVRAQNRVAKPSDIDGAWEGTLDTGVATLRLVVHIATFEDGMTAKMDSPDQNALGLPVTSITRDGPSLRFEMKQLAASFSGTLDTGLTTISGTWTQLGNGMPLALKRGGKIQ
jgi:hypothetical protein